MCEFCTKHGEGEKWYLQMRNHAGELLYEELSASQEQIANATVRLQWTQRFWRSFVLPAMTGVPSAKEDRPFTAQTPEDKRLEHLGQVLPIEDVEHVLDMVDSITRMACGCRVRSTGLADKRYCFGLGVDKWGILGQFPDSASSLEVLDRDEACRSFANTRRRDCFTASGQGLPPTLSASATVTAIAGHIAST
jgi:hypothetical protein